MIRKWLLPFSSVFVFVCEWSEERSKWPKSIVDVGCGIGGSSRYLAKKFGATSVGITLSPVQAQRANSLAAAQGLADKVFISRNACFSFLVPRLLITCYRISAHVASSTLRFLISSIYFTHVFNFQYLLSCARTSVIAGFL